jgi:hypothetical protein
VRGIDREKVVVWGVKGEFLTNFYRGVEHPLVASLFLLLISRRLFRKKTNKQRNPLFLREDPDGLSDGLMTDWALSSG